MTAIEDFVAIINDWTNYDDDVSRVTPWVRMAEERINQQLRIADQLQIDQAVFSTTPRVLLPSDWLEGDFIRVIGGGPSHYLPRDEFYADFFDDSARVKHTTGKHTIIGNYIEFGGTFDTILGTTVEMSYYGDVPQLDATPTWLSLRYSMLLTVATLTPAMTFHEEVEKAAAFETQANNIIEGLNAAHRISRTSGSVINKSTPKKGFG